MTKTNARIILGYGGTGQELARWLDIEDGMQAKFLDDIKTGPEVIGRIADVRSDSDETFALAIGSAKKMFLRAEMVERFGHLSFPAWTSKRAIAADTIHSKGTLVFPGAMVSTKVELASFVLIYHLCVVSHDCIIGRNSILANGTVLSGAVRIGSNTYIGANATVLENVTIGDNCIIAAGATVLSDIPDNTVYYGPSKSASNHYYISA